MQIKPCTFAATASEILAILNEAIVNTTSLYDYQPRSLQNMVAWFEAKEAGNYPVMGAFDDAGSLLGFASYGPFRNWPANQYTVEHSVYIHKDHQGKGIARVLMQALIQEAQRQGYHVLVGGIDATNQASIALHESLGFFHAGTIKHAGYKFDRWLDLAFYQLLLETSTRPTV
jgi:phosphinothricin acetyltransferase